MRLAMSSELVERLEVAAQWDSSPSQLIHEASARIEALEAKNARLREDRMKQIDYSCDLQRIIEDLCGGREIREPKTTARHHYDMAIAARVAIRSLKGGRDAQ